MEINIISNEENKLLGRKEIRFSAAHEKETESKENVKVELCKKLNLKPDSTIIIRINQHFGEKRISGLAHSYEKKDDMLKYEQQHLFKRAEKKSATVQDAAKQ